MDILKKFIEQNNERSLSLETVSLKTGIPYEQLYSFFETDLHLDLNWFTKKHRIIKEYYEKDTGKKISRKYDLSPDHLYDIKMKIYNPYSLNEYEVINLFIGKFLYNLNPQPGSIEEDGYYSSAWTHHYYNSENELIDSQNKIIDYLPNLPEILIAKLNIDYYSLSFNVKQWTCQINKIHFTHKNKTTAILNALKHFFLDKKTFFLIETFSNYEDPSDNEQLFEYHSFFLDDGLSHPIFFSQQEAQKYIESLNSKNTENLVYKIKEINTDETTRFSP